MSLSERKRNNPFRKSASKSSSASLPFSGKPEDNFFILATLGWLTMKDIARGARTSKGFHILILQVQQYAFLVKGRKIFAELTPLPPVDSSEEEESGSSNSESAELERKGAVPENILKVLNCINGWIALGEGLIPVDELRNLAYQALGIRADQFIEQDDSDFEEEDEKDSNYDKSKKRIEILIESEFGLVALQQKHLTFQDILKFKYATNLKIILSTKYGLMVLEEHLVELGELEVFRHRLLKVILSENGILALREKFISLSVLPPVSPKTLELMLTPQGKAAIRAGIITLEQAYNLENGIQIPIFSFWGLKMLSEDCLTLEQASTLGENICKIIMTEQGWYLFKNKLISVEQIMELENMVASSIEPPITYCQFLHLSPILTAIVSNSGIRLLEDKLIPMKRVMDMVKVGRYVHNHVRFLFSENGHKALADKIITLDKALTYSAYVLNHILCGTAFTTLFQSRFFTLEEVDRVLLLLDSVVSQTKLREFDLNARTIFTLVFSNNCRDAIQKGYASKQQVMQNPHVAFLFSGPKGKRLFEKGIVKFDDFLNFTNGDRFRFIISDEGIEILENGLLTIEQVGRLEITKYAHEFSSDDNSRLSTLKLYLTDVLPGRVRIDYNLLSEFRTKDHCQFLLDKQVRIALLQGEIGIRQCLTLNFDWFRDFFNRDGEFSKDKNTLILIYLKLQKLLPKEFEYPPTSDVKQTPVKSILNLLKDLTQHVITKLDSIQEYKDVKAINVTPSTLSQPTGIAEVKLASGGISSQYESLEQKQKPDTQLQGVAFRKIYQALRDGQSNLVFYKTNFLADNSHLSDEDLAKAARNYSIMHPNSRTAKAFQLTQIHYKNCNSDNTELFKEIYRWSFKSSHLFSLSSVMGPTFFWNNSLNSALDKNLLTADKIREGRKKQNSRTFNIAKALC